ncbi:hypothetical protein [Mucilaginibacter lappiensis]|uniref:hypothetical protein n=1 Tax=Mucilaginibacter lappiensis TaxID=354630 RepID=UPI003D213657
MKVGITGHQDLKNDRTIAWLKKIIIEQLEIRQPSAIYSSLAIGADQLFAKLALKLKIPLSVIIPCQHYEKTFDNENLKTFKQLLTQASGIVELNYPEPSEEAFYTAGKAIVEASDILFAVWDGQKAKGLGGTGDIVAHARALQKPILHLNLIKKSLRQF